MDREPKVDKRTVNIARDVCLIAVDDTIISIKDFLENKD